MAHLLSVVPRMKQSNYGKDQQESFKKLLKNFYEHIYYVNSVAFSPEGAFIFIGSSDETMKLWEISTGNFLKNFEGPTNYENSVALSPDGAFIVSYSSNDKVKLCEK